MRKITVIFLVLGLALTVMACGEKPAEKGATAKPGQQAVKKADKPAPAKGEAYDCEKFSLTLADGWKAGPLKMGMVNVLPNGKYSPGLYFKFEGNGNAAGTAEASIESMIERYNGSPMESTTIAGIEFKTTTYSHGGSDQTMHVAFHEGTKITITIEGKDAKNNADIKAMIASLKLK